MEEMGSLIIRIREKVIAEAEQKFADETFQHLRCSLNNARMADAHASTCVTGECGSSMEIYLKFRNDYIEEATYVTDADAGARMCGSCATELAIGKTCSQIMKLSIKDVLQRVGRSGTDAEKCALFALSALQKAVKDYRPQNGGAPSEKKTVESVNYFIAGYNSYHLKYSN